MQEPNQTVASPEAQTSTQTQVQTAEPDYKQLYEETSGKFKDLEGKYKEAESGLQNFESFIGMDDEVRRRGQLYIESIQSKKDYKELLKSQDTQTATTQPKGPTQQAPVFDESKLAKMIEQRVDPLLAPLRERNAEAEVERSKTQIFKQEPWMTEEKYKEFEVKFGKKIDELAQRELAGMGPFLTQAERQKASEQALSRAYQSYAAFSDADLVRAFMGEDRDKWIAEGRRMAPKLPDGMVDNLPVGKAPELLTQLKQAYKSIQGNGKAVASLCQEYAPKLGRTEEQVYALLEK